MSPEAEAICAKYGIGAGKSWWCRTVSDPRNINDLHEVCENSAHRAACTCRCHR